MDLSQIVGNQDWPSYTAQSQKMVYGQQSALMYLYDHNEWDNAHKLDCIRLIPEGVILYLTHMKKHAYVIQVLDVVALVWPLVATSSPNVYKLDLTVSRLEFVCLLRLDDAKVKTGIVGLHPSLDLFSIFQKPYA
jgi:hypothetical protein